MPSNPYDPKILEFLYYLAKNDRYMTFKEISEKFRLEKNGKKFAYRTILRWVSELRKTRDFNYYPNIKASSFGLLPSMVYIEKAKIADVISIIPYKLYLEYGVNMKKLKDSFIVEYLVPYNHINEFQEFWKTARDIGIVEDFTLFPVRAAVAFYPPFHKVMDSQGNLHFDIDFDIRMYVKILDNSIEKDMKIEIHEEIRKNPMIVPVALAMDKEPHLSSRDLWRFIKKLTGENIWDYFVYKNEKESKKEGACVDYIKNTVESFVSNKDLVRQIRVSYSPFYKRNLGVYLILKPKNRHSLLKISEIMAKKSILTVVSPPYNSDDDFVIYYFVSDIKSTSLILEEIGNYVDYRYNIITFLRNHEKTVPFVMGPTPDTPVSKIRYWEIFDPLNVEWKYEHEKYMEELDRLSERQ